MYFKFFDTSLSKEWTDCRPESSVCVRVRDRYVSVFHTSVGFLFAALLFHIFFDKKLKKLLGIRYCSVDITVYILKFYYIQILCTVS